MDLIRRQDYSPAFNLASERLEVYFRALREEEFLDEVFSLYGKWSALTRGEESYGRFVREAFERHLLQPARIREVLDRIRGDYVFVLAGMENRLLVALEEDPPLERPGLTLEGLRSEYGRLAAELAPAVLSDLGMNVASLVGSEVAAALMTASLTSAGILGGATAAGAGSGWVTFGVGLVMGAGAGWVLDAAVDREWEESVRMEIRRHLNAVRNRMIDDVHGALARVVEAHQALQVECVRRLTVEGGPDEHVARHD